MTIADLAFRSSLAHALGGSLAVKLLLATMVYFVINTFLVAGAISFSEKKGLVTIWRECYVWAFPYYLLHATLAYVINWANLHLGWEFSLLALPASNDRLCRASNSMDR